MRSLGTLGLAKRSQGPTLPWRGLRGGSQTPGALGGPFLNPGVGQGSFQKLALNHRGPDPRRVKPRPAIRLGPSLLLGPIASQRLFVGAGPAAETGWFGAGL